ncbi:MAG: SurA N-terminal domain-containing protein [Chitinophagales bacterium]|nr:SurA N-terminal domain-containing protein [Chitinophagales bacterium]MCZ2393870.1 SurA N-terminal domain-containing protein [Chitinophagales bacterium]
MALIGKIRQKTGLLLGFIGVSMLIFLVQEAISSQNLTGGSTKTLGKINGEKVDAAEFFNDVSAYENRLKTLNPNISFNEQNSMYIREEVWNNFAVKYILGNTIEKLGLTVSNDELAEAFKGETINPLVMNVLGQSFINPETGMFDKAKMEEALNNMDAVDSRLRETVIQLEPLVEQDRIRTKYSSLVAKSAYIPSFLAESKLAENKLLNIDVLSVPYSTIDDSKVTVTDAEIDAYIKNHPLKYQRDANFIVDIVTFDVVPNSADIEEITKQVLQNKEGLLNSDDDSLYIARSSVQGGNIAYQTAEEIKNFGRVNADSLSNAPEGSFVGPYKEGNDIVLSYIAGKKLIPDSVRASRIILSYKNAADVEAKKKLAEQIIQDIKEGKASFAQKASEFSDEPSAKGNGGDFGFIPHGSVEPDFNKRLFYDMSVGQIESIETPSGIFILQKTAQVGLKPAVRVIDFSSELVASDATSKEIYNNANNFWNDSKTPKSFDEKSKTQKTLKDISFVAKDVNVGGIEGTRPVVAWAFKEGKVGDVNFFDLSDKYVIVKIDAKNEKGLAKVSDVKNEINPILMNEKKAALIQKNLSDSKTAGLEALANKSNGQIHNGVIVQANNSFVSQLGMEPKIVGTAIATKEGKQSAAISGNNGVYVVKTNSIEDLSGSVDLKVFQNQLYRQNASALNFDNIFSTILKNSKIDDKRYMVY